MADIKFPSEVPSLSPVTNDTVLLTAKDGLINKVTVADVVAKTAELAQVNGGSIPAITGGATPETAVALPNLGAGTNKYFDASSGYWKYNDVVLTNPDGGQGVPEGSEGVLFWNGTTQTWSISKVQELPMVEVANDFGNSTTKAISQAKVSEINSDINQEPIPEYFFGATDISTGTLFILGAYAYLVNSPAIQNTSETALFEYKAIATGTVILLHLRLQSDNSLLEVARQSFTVSSTGIKSHVIELNVIPGDRFAVIGDGVVARGVSGNGYFSAPTSRNPIYFNASELVTPTQPTVGLGYHVKIKSVEAGLKSQIESAIKEQDLTITSGKNKFNKLTMILLNKLVSNTGLLDNVTGAKASRTPVKPSTEYSLQLSRYEANSGGVIRFIRADLTLISFVVGLNLPASNSGIGKKLTTPPETAYIENNIYFSTTNFTDMTDTFQIEEGGSVTSYSAFEEGVSEIKGKKIYSENSGSAKTIPHIDKNILFLGDSILASTTYDIVARLLTHMTFKSVVRLARSGATWTNTVDTVYDITSTGGSTTPDNVIWNEVNKYKKMIADGLTQIPDIIVSSAGTNDFGRPKGDVTTAFTGSIIGKPANQILTLTEAVRWNLELMFQEWPNVQVILVTPIQRGIADNSVIFDIGDKIEACGKRLSVSVIRQDQVIGIYGYKELNSPYFLYDFLHPNQIGANKIGDNIAPIMLSIISPRSGV